MIKIFCDCCGSEMGATMTEAGNFKIQEKVLNFIKHQKQDQIRVQEFVFCIACARKVRDYFQGLKNSNQINGGDTK